MIKTRYKLPELKVTTKKKFFSWEEVKSLIDDSREALVAIEKFLKLHE